VGEALEKGDAVARLVELAAQPVDLAEEAHQRLAHARRHLVFRHTGERHRLLDGGGRSGIGRRGGRRRLPQRSGAGYGFGVADFHRDLWSRDGRWAPPPATAVLMTVNRPTSRSLL